VKELLPAHAISRCDTVGAYHGIGKGTVVKMLKAGHKLSAIGDVDSSHEEVTRQATKFISACYGYPNSKSLFEARLLVWAKKNGKGVTSAPKLCAIPPTTEAFQENVKRAHYQAIIWQYLDSDDVPDVHPENFGWKKDMSTKSLTPVAIPESVPLASDYILKLICCGCSSQNDKIHAQRDAASKVQCILSVQYFVHSTVLVVRVNLSRMKRNV